MFPDVFVCPRGAGGPCMMSLPVRGIYVKGVSCQEAHQYRDSPRQKSPSRTETTPWIVAVTEAGCTHPTAMHICIKNK